MFYLKIIKNKFKKCSFERDDQIINYIITSPTFNEDCKILFYHK